MTTPTSDATLTKEATQAAPGATNARESRWAIDASHTLVEFSARHMMITTVKGRFSKLSGTVVINEEDPNRSLVETEIDVSSIDTQEEKRDAHLRSAEFLDVEKFPKMTFKSRRVDGAAKKEGDTFKLTGDLTLHGVTKEVTLDVTYEGRGKDPWGGERRSFSAQTQLDRRDFGLVWNVALETGGILVSNTIKIALEVQLVKQAS